MVGEEAELRGTMTTPTEVLGQGWATCREEHGSCSLLGSRRGGTLEHGVPSTHASQPPSASLRPISRTESWLNVGPAAS